MKTQFALITQEPRGQLVASNIRAKQATFLARKISSSSCVVFIATQSNANPMHGSNHMMRQRYQWIGNTLTVNGFCLRRPHFILFLFLLSLCVICIITRDWYFASFQESYESHFHCGSISRCFCGRSVTFALVGVTGGGQPNPCKDKWNSGCELDPIR